MLLAPLCSAWNSRADDSLSPSRAQQQDQPQQGLQQQQGPFRQQEQEQSSVLLRQEQQGQDEEPQAQQLVGRVGISKELPHGWSVAGQRELNESLTSFCAKSCKHCCDTWPGVADQWVAAREELGIAPPGEASYAEIIAYLSGQSRLAQQIGVPGVSGDLPHGCMLQKFHGTCAAAFRHVALVYVRIYKSGTQSVCANLQQLDDGSIDAHVLRAAEHGHRHEGGPKVVTFTFVREPISHFVSGYTEVSYRAHKQGSTLARNERLYVEALLGHPNLYHFMRFDPSTRVAARAFVRDFTSGNLGRVSGSNDDQHVFPQISFLSHAFASSGPGDEEGSDAVGAAAALLTSNGSNAASPVSPCNGSPISRLDFVGNLEAISIEWERLGAHVLSLAMGESEDEAAEARSVERMRASVRPITAGRLVRAARRHHLNRSLLRSWPMHNASDGLHPHTNVNSSNAAREAMDSVLASDESPFVTSLCRVLLPDYVCFDYQLPQGCAEALGKHDVVCEAGVTLAPRLPLHIIRSIAGEFEWPSLMNKTEDRR